MDYQTILKELRAGTYRPVYLLHGTEPYFIDRVSDYIEQHALSAAERAFNQTILYGKDVDPQALLDTVRRYPMMAPRQVVLVKEAQDLAGGLKRLEDYLTKPAPTTVLVLAWKHKRFNAKTKLAKGIEKAGGAVVEGKQLYDSQVPDWIVQYLKTKKLRIEGPAAALIAEYVGTELGKVANELDKLALNLPEGTTVTDQLVAENIGISREYNVFELQRALGARDELKAQRIVRNFQQNKRKHPLVMTVASLSNFFAKLFAYQQVRREHDSVQLKAMGMGKSWQLRDYKAAAHKFNRAQTERALRILRDYDLRAKGVQLTGTGDYELGDATPQEQLLQEMVWKLLRA